jgi:predicted ATPase
MARYQTKASAPFLRELSVIPGAELPDKFPFNLPILQQGKLRLRFTRRITILVGENGSGKSSLLEAIAAQCGFNLASGSGANLYAREQTHETFASVLRLAWMPRIRNGFFLRAESFYNFATHIDEIEREVPRDYENYGGKSLHQQSHGESFVALFQNRFGGPGIILLDEPEAALSPTRQLAFLRILRDLDAAGQTQIIMATHSPILMAYPGAQVLYIDGGAFKEVRYDETGHFTTMKQFLADPERTLKHLFED